MNCLVLADGHRVTAESLIGSGLDGFVIRHGSGCVLKIPKLFARLQSDGRVEAYSDDANELALEDLEVEKTVYERLRGVPGVAKCIECTSNGILLEYYANGSLSEYISAHSHNPPSMSQRWRWAVQATDIIARCHERGVLVFDIALRNFVLTENLDLRIIDFANSSLVPLSPSIDFSRVNVIGCTAGLDLLHLSNVIYSIMVILGCWTRKYTSVQDMAPELRLCIETPSSTRPLERQTQAAEPSDRPQVYSSTHPKLQSFSDQRPVCTGCVFTGRTARTRTSSCTQSAVNVLSASAGLLPV
ncbi:hypothetical protein LTR53_007113 [Teratosphaeriaceae sp. CCFEE 6253]|nr:hypothetical protein LTR53_007113 [Teratosphaeriaceae sp. CCFEE 6253]